MPYSRPNYKLNCVWCTVELKVIGNLECRIKFYREKKPRHFFYTIEYPYPPTNSAGVPFAVGPPVTGVHALAFVHAVAGTHAFAGVSYLLLVLPLLAS